MFLFQNPQYLYLLLLLPLLIVVYLWSVWSIRRRKKRLGESRMVNALMPGRSTIRRHVKFTLLLLALALLIVMSARPQYGLRQQTDTTKGIEAVVMIDVSNSMLARDVQSSRLDRAKLLITTMVDRMKNDKIALGVFAGEAYPQLPITSDYASARVFIDALSAGMVTLQGTDIGAAIDLGSQSFTTNKNVGKAIILITDGEDHEAGAEEAAARAAKAGINVFVVGVGSSEGAEIPTPQGVLTDETGNPVRTRLNEDMCRKVATAGKGIYLHLNGTGSAQDELLSRLAQMKQDSSTTTYTARDEQFQAVGLLVLLLLIIEVFVSETQNSFFQRIKIFRK